MITKEEFINLIKNEYPSCYQEIIENMMKKRSNAFRINTLLSSKDQVLSSLDKLNIKYHKVDISDFSYLVDSSNQELMNLDLFKEGKIYLQSISSQIPPLVLDLDKNMDILDMCAAPGGKTSEIAQIVNNSSNIMACEENKIRCEKLKYNLSHLGCKNINVMLTDARKLDSFFRFDSILLDAPCSGSGTINIENNKDLSYFSLLLVKNSAKTQKALLKKAIEILKPGSSMVYSTCSILKEENEEVVKTVLNKNVVLEDININIDEACLLESSLDKVLTIKPSTNYEGFFIAKIKKLR